MKLKPNTTKEQISKSEISPLTILLLFASFLLTYCIVIIGLEYDITSLTWNIFAMSLGLLTECYFIYKHLDSILKRLSISIFISLIIFLPIGSEKEYTLQNHIQAWPYIFFISFISGIALSKPEEVTTRQTEGTTLLQSLALIYWLFESNYFTNTKLTNIILFSLIGASVIFSLIHAFTKFALGEINRLFLSIWSCIVLICFSLDNLIKVFNNADISQQNNLLMNIEFGIQYFFVGISSIYVMQNILMILAFFPQEKIEYAETFDIAKKMHLDRYSNLQVSKTDSIFCILFCSFFFILNHRYQLLPTSTSIWIVIITFPLFLNLIKYRKE